LFVQSESKHCYEVLRDSWAELDRLLATKEGRARMKSTFNMCK
jgi:lysosomal Pro-X carboxypeptidase